MVTFSDPKTCKIFLKHFSEWLKQVFCFFFYHNIYISISNYSKLLCRYVIIIDCSNKNISFFSALTLSKYFYTSIHAKCSQQFLIIAKRIIQAIQWGGLRGMKPHKKCRKTTSFYCIITDPLTKKNVWIRYSRQQFTHK